MLTSRASVSNHLNIPGFIVANYFWKPLPLIRNLQLLASKATPPLHAERSYSLEQWPRSEASFPPLVVMLNGAIAMCDSCGVKHLLNQGDNYINEVLSQIE
ncbi:MAG TPA: hypothetical protein VN721_03595 [Flavipsychrobacter sp.]|nr:hypothetical protein [Flavipsychrobacter sp.]